MTERTGCNNRATYYDPGASENNWVSEAIHVGATASLAEDEYLLTSLQELNDSHDCFQLYNNREIGLANDYLALAHKFDLSIEQSSVQSIEDCNRRKEAALSSKRRKVITKPKPAKSTIQGANLRLKGCGCQTSNCLRLYCKCFGKQGYCGEGCECVECFNTREFESQRRLVIEKTLEICRTSFAPKVTTTETGVQINAEGCRCKSGCRSKHCLCSKNGVGCSPICRCSGCRNDKIELSQEEVKRYYRNPLRTKERLLFNSTPSSKSEDLPESSLAQTTDRRTTVVVFKKADEETIVSTGGDQNAFV